MLCLFSAPACLPRAEAQQTSAATSTTLSGTVLDARGGALAGASIEAKNEAGGATQRATTDGQGRFRMTTLSPGTYTVLIAATGFAPTTKTGVVLSATSPVDLPTTLSVGTVSQQVTVEAAGAGSIAAELAPMDGLLEARSARTEITPMFIQNFASPVADYSELIQMAPGTFSINSNGVGLGDSKTYFRGFQDGLYDITFDGIPFEDTNSPTHHSWAFFPSQWIGGIDFDRSPGSASTIGPTPFGGSVNLLSKETTPERNIRGGVSYGSFNTMLVDGEYDSGNFGGRAKRSNVLLDVHRLTSDGFQTLNAQQRWAGSMKYQYKITEKTVLTGYAGVLMLDTNTPNVKGPTRAQVAQFGYNYLLNSDPTSSIYVGYNYYHVPTDFEYVGVRSEFGRGWTFDSKPYTYSYYNQQNYANAPSTLGGVITSANCVAVKGISPCATNKLNSYRKYGANSVATQVSRYGVFRTGLWYEWASTDRYQYPSNPLTHRDDVLPNFHEKFWTNSYQPYAEYEYHVTPKLTATGGFKLAYYTQDLKQFADNGATVGNLGGAPFTRNNGTYTSYLPSADVNYRIRQNWSAYGQFSTGSVIPPSNVFDVKVTTVNVNPVTVLPKPTGAKTYQTGSVLKLRRATLNGDVYYTHFQNAYTSNPDPNNTSGTAYQTAGDSVSKGFEGEANVFLAHGLSLYGNGTVGTARYVSAALANATGAPVLNPNYNSWVANTPGNTETLGLTYQSRSMDFGMFNKRIGPMWNDTNGTGTITYQGQKIAVKTLNQILPIDAFQVTNLFLNYTVRNGGRLDQTKLRLSFNNLFNTNGITSLTQAAKSNTYAPGPGDTLGLLPGRSVTVSVTFGYSPKR